MSNQKSNVSTRDMLFGTSDRTKPLTENDSYPDTQNSEIAEQEQERREREVLEKAKKSTIALQNTLKMAREIRQIGDETMIDLNKQKGQLKNMHGKLDHIDQNVSQSYRLVKKMERKWYDPRSWI